MSPRKIAPPTPEVPAAGVIATSPATAPDAPPSREGLPETSRSAAIQPSTPAAGATKVLIIAIAAPPVASRLDPALKPNQPTQRRPVPINVLTTQSGGVASLRHPLPWPPQNNPKKP